MEQQLPTVMTFGKYKGRDIKDVPLSYLRWWKSCLVESLRVSTSEIHRREEMGLTEDEELQLGTLPSFVRDNLLHRLEECGDEEDRAAIHGIIQIKFQEYSPKCRASNYGRQDHPAREEPDEIFYEDAPG